MWRSARSGEAASEQRGDYKFSSAVLEDFFQLAPGRRERFLAASVYNLPGSLGADNDLADRTAAALAG